MIGKAFLVGFNFGRKTVDIAVFFHIIGVGKHRPGLVVSVIDLKQSYA